MSVYSNVIYFKFGISVQVIQTFRQSETTSTSLTRNRVSKSILENFKMLNISNQFRILTAPDINTELNPANEILRFSDHLVWLENFIQTKFGEYSVLIEGNNLPELIHPVWTSASESGITLEIFNNQYNEISSRISKRKETLPLVVGAVISTFSSNFLTYINNTASAKVAKRNNDVIEILKEAKTWFMAYLNPTTGAEVNPQDKKDYLDKFNELKQTHDQTVEDWKKTFISHVEILTKTFGIEMTESEQAFNFMIKLNNLYKSKVDKIRMEEEAFKVKKKHHPTIQKDKGFPTTMTEAYDTARLWQHQYNRSREWNIKPSELKPEPVSELESEDSEEKEEDKVNLKPQEISYAKVTTKFKVRDKRNHSEESEQDSTSVDSQSVAKEKPMPFQIDYEKLAELLAPKIFELQQQQKKVSAYSCEVTDTNIDWSKPANSYSH